MKKILAFTLDGPLLTELMKDIAHKAMGDVCVYRGSFHAWLMKRCCTHFLVKKIYNPQGVCTGYRCMECEKLLCKEKVKMQG